MKRSSRAPRNKSAPVGGAKKAPRPQTQRSLARQAQTVENIERRFDDNPQYTESVQCPVNPYALIQALYGYYGAQATHSDSVFDVRAIMRMALFSAQAIISIENCGLDTLPDFVVAIADGLRPRRVGTDLLSPNFTDLRAAIASYIGGSNAGYTMQSIVLPSAYDVTGFPSTIASTSNLPSSDDMKILLTGYCPMARMVSVNARMISMRDCSAFAFDNGVPQSSPALRVRGGSYWQCGFLGTDAYWLPEISTVGCEGLLATKWLYSLRLCTPPRGTAGTDNNTTWIRRPGVGPSATRVVQSIPAVVGHFFALKRGVVPTNAQLKLCPSAAPIKDLALRLEAHVSAMSPSNVTAYKALFSPGEISILLFGMWFSTITRYGWYTIGAAWSQDTGAPINLGIPGMHAQTKLWDTVQVPRVFAQLFGAVQPWQDKDGVLLPAFQVYQVPVSYPGTGGFWTGSATPTIPSTASYSSYFSKYKDYIRRWRSAEVYLAQVTSLSPVTKLGGSLLDVSITRDSLGGGSANLVAIHARRPLSSMRTNLSLNSIAYVSYDYQAPLGNLDGSASRSKLYRQPYMDGLSGTETFDDILAISIYNGIVNPGTEASQNWASDSNVRGPSDTAFGVAYEYPWWERAMHAMVPRHGMYGGPAYTAGESLAGRPNPKMRRVGNRYEYLVPPQDEEDAAYKRHDEDYFHAHELGIGSYAEADERLYETLLNLTRTTGLSPYGKAAREIFRPADRNDLFE